MPNLFEFYTGTESKVQPYNKQSLQSLLDLFQGGGLQGNPLYEGGSNFLQNLFSGAPGAFESFEAPFKQQFEQQTVPGIAERFAGMGTGAGAMSSSGLYNSLAQAGRGLSTDLASLRSGLQMQALPQALGYAQAPINNIIKAAQNIPGQYYDVPGKEGLIITLLKALAGAAGTAARGGK